MKLQQLIDKLVQLNNNNAEVYIVQDIIVDGVHDVRTFSVKDAFSTGELVNEVVISLEEK
jgi:hypothetical protein